MPPCAVVNASMRPVEVWGGLECSVARIGDGVYDQILATGHDHRLTDIDDIAALGLTAIRYPVLWERVAPDHPDRPDWSWTDRRLGRLRELGVRPIVTLLHHGKGPSHTDLTAADFAQGFADFAGRVAERYPWVDAYTPINEPLTTARFSGLYGVWHPHARDHRTFVRLLINQVKGIGLAMRAIRAVNPDARLIQTEDLGRAYSTPRLAYQAEHENARRWLTFDLLTGRVDRDHPLWSYLVGGGADGGADGGVEQDLEDLRAAPCPPDILGIDHYLTSERFLDERVERYPGWSHTDNGRDRYADVEAVRVVAEGTLGYENLLREAWERYRLPVAATEAHNGSSREEQLRWLKEVWDGAQRLRGQGVDIRAVTAWALLGSYDWNSLMTRRAGYYESGVFDVRGRRPRPTALARLLRDLAATGTADHPTLDAPGWWHRPDRFHWSPVRCCPFTVAQRLWIPPNGRRAAQPLLITGGGGTLARTVARFCVVRGLPYHLVARPDLDAADPASVAAAIERYRPWAIINAAGCARVDRAETDPDRCRQANVETAAVLARGAAAAGIPLLTFSSHLVFDGGKAEAYVEDDATGPLGVYGAAKRDAERMALAALADTLIIRAGSFFGPWDQGNVAARAIDAVTAGREFRAADDVTVSPTYLPDLVNVALDLLIDGETGVWHLASQGAVTWADFAREVVARANLDSRRVRGVSGADLGWSARRPAFGVLGSSRGLLMPSLDRALASYAETWAAAGSHGRHDPPAEAVGW